MATIAEVEYINEDLDIIADVTWEDIDPTSLRELEEDGLDFFQRSFMPAKFAYLDKHFDQRAVGSLVISRRATGDDVILDGRHRVRVCKKHGVETVHCQVLRGLTRQEEAKLFLFFNNRGVPKAIELFRSRRVAGDPFVTDVIAGCNDAGWDVRKGAGSPCVTQAANAICRCYRGAPRGANKRGWLTMILRIIGEAWPDDKRNGEALVIGAVHTFWKQVELTQPRRDRFTSKLSICGLTSLIGRAQQMRTVFGKTGEYVLAMGMLEEYNKNLHSGAKLHFSGDEVPA